MPLRIGLVGAGPWALGELGPAVNELATVELSGLWSRSPERAHAVGRDLDCAVFDDYEDLLAHCDAVVMAVAPSAQPEPAIAAARAGRAVWLEKPLAATLEAAEAMAVAIRSAQVPTFFHLPYRESTEVQALAAWSAAAPIEHVRVSFLSGALLRDTDINEGWRGQGSQADGVLLDLGPHGLGMAEQVAGPIRSVSAQTSQAGWHCFSRHDRCTSMTTVMARVAIDPSITQVEALADDRRGSGQGYMRADARAETRRERSLRALERFVNIIERGMIDHEFTVDAGVRMQRLLEAARRSAESGVAITIGDDREGKQP